MKIETNAFNLRQSQIVIDEKLINFGYSQKEINLAIKTATNNINDKIEENGNKSNVGNRVKTNTNIKYYY